MRLALPLILMIILQLPVIGAEFDSPADPASVRLLQGQLIACFHTIDLIPQTTVKIDRQGSKVKPIRDKARTLNFVIEEPDRQIKIPCPIKGGPQEVCAVKIVDKYYSSALSEPIEEVRWTSCYQMVQPVHFEESCSIANKRKEQCKFYFESEDSPQIISQGRMTRLQ
jgi:hypothetical protein